MNGIKLPVTGVSIIEGELTIWDRNGVEIEMRASDHADALNAAPTRAFEGLTVEALGNAMKDAAVSAGDTYPPKPDEATWRNKYLTALLSKIQAFAAPQVPQWMPIGAEGASGQVFFGYSKCDGLSIWVLEAVQGGENWYECVYSEAGHSEDLPTVTHWMPLPAPPEAQGGENDA